MGGAVSSLFGGGQKKAQKIAEQQAAEARRRQLADMARQAADVDQQRVAGVNTKRGRLLSFAQSSGDTLGSSA